MHSIIRPSKPANFQAKQFLAKHAAVTLLSVSVLGGIALARTTTYWSSSSGDFASVPNWTAGTPTDVVDANIDNAGTAKITAPFTQPIVYVFLGSVANTSGTLEISGSGSADLTSLVVGGRNGIGTVKISGGGTLTSYGGAIAADIGSTGVAMIDGVGSNWSITGPEMRLGSIGKGTTTVQNGGSLTVGSTGTGKITLAAEGVAEGSLYIGNGTSVGAINAGEIASGNGKALLVFNHTNAALVINAKLTGVIAFSSANSSFEIRHEGPGTTILTSAQSTLAGLLTVAGGKLMVNGSIKGSVRDVVVDDQVVSEKNIGTFSVLPAGTLGGTGFLEGKTNVEGVLAPGMGVGVLTFGGDLTLQSTAVVSIELAGKVRGASFDAIDAAGALTYGGTLKLTLTNGFLPSRLDTFDLFNGYNAFSGTFTSIQFSSPGYSGVFNPQTGVLTVIAVPEPTVYGLAILGTAFLATRRRTGTR